MSTRLDAALSKYPEHEEGIRLLVSRDPSGGKLKYLDWGAKILASGQALAGEIADVLDLFHQFAGRRLDTDVRVGGRVYRRRSAPGQRVHPDINTYQPGDLAKLRELLGKMKKAADKKRRKRERLYKIEGTVEAEVVYDSDDLIVRHIKNKQASVHYGHATKWCISMLREGYFEEYETHNATFFFFERKTPKGDEYDKVALMIPRSYGDGDRFDRDQGGAHAFTTLDQQVDMMVLAKVHGPRVFDIFRQVYEKSEQYPGSTMFQVYSGTANAEQLATIVASVTSGDLNGYEPNALLEAILLQRRGAVAVARRDRARRLRVVSRGQQEQAVAAIPQVPQSSTRRAPGRLAGEGAGALRHGGPGDPPERPHRRPREAHQDPTEAAHRRRRDPPREGGRPGHDRVRAQQWAPR